MVRSSETWGKTLGVVVVASLVLEAGLEGVPPLPAQMQMEAQVK